MKQEQITFTIPKCFSNFKKLNIDRDTVCLGTHFHTAVEFVFVKKGAILCRSGKDFVHIPENHILVVGSNVIHHLEFDNAPAEIYYLQVDVIKVMGEICPEFHDMPPIFDNSLKKYALFSEESHIYKLFQNILYELEVQNPYFETSTIGGLIQLTAYLQREQIVADFDKLFKNPFFIKILPIITYANEHYSQKVYLDNISDTLHMDKYYLCKVFKKATGITFFQYLNIIRLQNAEKLLVTTNKSITEIALECGFSTTQYFNSVFVRATGYSPSLYRKSYYKNSTV